MNWPTAQLGQICSPKQHKTIPASTLLDEGFPVYGANGQIGFYSEFTHEEETVAITCRGATCGTINVAPAKSYITGNAMALDDLDRDRVELRFLVYALRNRGLHDVISGSAQPQITRGPLLAVEIPLPPLEEQKRIAAILDQADDLRRKRQHALTRLNQLGQAIFYEMFGDPDRPNSWRHKTVPLSLVCDKITDGTHQSPKWSDEGVPFIFVSNVRNHKIDFATKKFVSIEEYQSLTKHSKIEDGDVLYTCVGSYGHTAVVDGMQDFVFQRHIAHLKPNKLHIEANFLAWCLESDSVKQQADKLATGIAQKTVTLTSLKKIEIPLPPIEQQKLFANRIATLSDFEEDFEGHTSKLDALFTSLQHRAFRGEL